MSLDPAAHSWPCDWDEVAVRKVLLPVRRPDTLALSGDGRLGLGVASVATVLRASAIGRSAGASADSGNGARSGYADDLSTKLVDPSLLRARAIFPAAVGHTMACDTRATEESRAAGEPFERSLGPSSLSPNVDDVHGLTWTSVSFGPVLAFIDSSNAPRFSIPFISSQSMPLSVPTACADPFTSLGEWKQVALPKQFTERSKNQIAANRENHNTCSQIHEKEQTVECEQLSDTSSDRTTEFPPPDVLCVQFSPVGSCLLAVGSKKDLTVWKWPYDPCNAGPELLAIVHDEWTRSIAWLPHSDLSGCEMSIASKRREDAYLATGTDGEIRIYHVQITHSPGAGSVLSTISTALAWSSGKNTLMRSMVCCLEWWSTATCFYSSSNEDVLSLACADWSNLALIKWTSKPSNGASSSDLKISRSCHSHSTAWGRQLFEPVCVISDVVKRSPSNIFSAKNAHNTLITCVSFTQSGQVFSSSTDGVVLLWQEGITEESLAVTERLSGGDVSLSKLGSHLSCIAAIRKGSPDTEAYGLCLSMMGLSIVVLLNMGPFFSEDGVPDSGLSQKFKAATRRSRVALYLPRVKDSSALSPSNRGSGSFKEDIEERIRAAICRLIWGARCGNAFATWDLRLWLETLPPTIQGDALSRILTYVVEISKLLPECQQRSHLLLCARVIYCLSRVVARAASLYKLEDTAKAARAQYENARTIILLSHCENILKSFRSWYERTSEFNSRSELLALSNSRSLTESEIWCLNAVTAFVTFHGPRFSPLPATAQVLVEGNLMRQRLSACGSLSSSWEECPICAFDETLQCDLARNEDDPDLSFLCPQGDKFPLCVLTMRPCTNSIPLCCAECGAMASYKEEVSCNSSAAHSDNHIEFCWHPCQSRCPFCCSVFEISTFDSMQPESPFENDNDSI